MMHQQYEPVIYQTADGALELRRDISGENIWATQAEIGELFDVDQSVVSRHIRNIFKDGEVDAKSNMQKMHIAHSDKPISLYSLDVILAVGYRVNSRVAIRFRQWATNILRAYIIDGYTIHPHIRERNIEKFLSVISEFHDLVPTHTQIIGAHDVIELVREFSNTWLALHAYDQNEYPQYETNRISAQFTASDLSAALTTLKHALLSQWEATELFGIERTDGALESIVGNVFQSVFGTDAYPSAEEKAVHLLYFIVKDHPFVDGNKRSGAFAFVWFLEKAGILDIFRISPEALTALALFIAESKPSDKNRVVGLVVSLLHGNNNLK